MFKYSQKIKKPLNKIFLVLAVSILFGTAAYLPSSGVEEVSATHNCVLGSATLKERVGEMLCNRAWYTGMPDCGGNTGNTVPSNPTECKPTTGQTCINGEPGIDAQYRSITSCTPLAHGTPEITVTPASQDFNLVETGAYATRSFIVENTGSGTLQGGVIGLSGEFSCTSNCSGWTLDAGESVTVAIRYTPSGVGADVGSATFTCPTCSNGPIIRSLSAEGVLPDAGVSYQDFLDGGSFRADSYQIRMNASWPTTVSPGETFDVDASILCVGDDYSGTHDVTGSLALPNVEFPGGPRTINCPSGGGSGSIGTLQITAPLAEGTYTRNFFVQQTSPGNSPEQLPQLIVQGTIQYEVVAASDVTITADPTSVVSGSDTEITFNANGKQNCVASNSRGLSAWDFPVASGVGDQVFPGIGPITQMTIFIIWCDGNSNGGIDPGERDTQAVTIAAALDPPIVDLQVNGSDSPPAVTDGDLVTIEWDNTAGGTPTSCSGDGSQNSGWNYVVPGGAALESGIDPTQFDTTGYGGQTINFRLDCSNGDGSDFDTVSLTVNSGVTCTTGDVVDAGFGPAFPEWDTCEYATHGINALADMEPPNSPSSFNFSCRDYECFDCMTDLITYKGQPRKYVDVTCEGNIAPATPSIDAGSPTTGTTNVATPAFTFHPGADPDGDQVRYLIYWGDGTPTQTLGFQNSGLSNTAPHTFTSAGTYNVIVQAQDEFGASSPWSAAHTIVISNASASTIDRFEAVPSTVNVGTDTQLEWETSGSITSCQWENFTHNPGIWVGGPIDNAVVPGVDTGPEGITVYNLRCFGGSNPTDTTSVTVNENLATYITAYPTTIYAGEDVTFEWRCPYSVSGNLVTQMELIEISVMEPTVGTEVDTYIHTFPSAGTYTVSGECWGTNPLVETTGIGFVTITVNPALTQCNDGIDNADPEDTLADEDDPRCHTDGDATNSASYDPTINSEVNLLTDWSDVSCGGMRNIWNCGTGEYDLWPPSCAADEMLQRRSSTQCSGTVTADQDRCVTSASCVTATTCNWEAPAPAPYPSCGQPPNWKPTGQPNEGLRCNTGCSTSIAFLEGLVPPAYQSSVFQTTGSGCTEADESAGPRTGWQVVQSGGYCGGAGFDIELYEQSCNCGVVLDPPIVVLQVNGSDSPPAVTEGDLVTIDWDNTAGGIPTSCSGDGTQNSGWNYVVPGGAALESGIDPTQFDTAGFGGQTLNFKLDCSNGDGSDSDTVSLVVNSIPEPVITLGTVHVGDVVDYDTQAELTWNAAPADSCTFIQGTGINANNRTNQDGGGTDKFTSNITSFMDVQMNCCNGTSCVNSAVLRIGALPQQPAFDVTDWVAAGGLANVGWNNILNANSCYGVVVGGSSPGNAPNDWDGKAVGTSNCWPIDASCAQIGPISVDPSDYHLECSNAYGQTRSALERVEIIDPVASITALPKEVLKGRRTTVSWDAQGVLGACTLDRTPIDEDGNLIEGEREIDLAVPVGSYDTDAFQDQNSHQTGAINGPYEYEIICPTQDILAPVLLRETITISPFVPGFEEE